MRRLGQHFLTDAGALKKIAAALRPRRGETIIEIGPGHGELTRALGDRLQVLGFRDEKIIAIEKDVELVRTLQEKFANEKNIEVVFGDALKLLSPTTQNLKPKTYAIVGNIPYYITGYLLRVIQKLGHKPHRTVLTVQSEVANRVAATPPRMNQLAAAVQFWANPKIIAHIPRTAFAPMPKIDSTVIVLETKTASPPILPERYFNTVHAIFKQPRKTLLNNLADASRERPDAKKHITDILESLHIPATARPQDLSFENIVALAEQLAVSSASL